MKPSSEFSKVDAGATRDLQFQDLQSAVNEVQKLLECGYERRGNWSLAQICRHLCLVQDPSIDGYPKWMSLFAFLRPLMRRMLWPRVMSGNSPKGIPTAPVFAPPQGLDDSAEASKFLDSVARFRAHAGEYASHPAFGRLSRERLEFLHAAHAAHHLRFLMPLMIERGGHGSSPHPADVPD